MINIDGAEIFLNKIQGNGNLNFVLIHNAGGNHQFFYPQIECLKSFGNIVQLDMPGHGQSMPIEDNSMENLSNILLKICNQLSLENICFIGLNNGADVVLNTAARHHLSIHSVILIDPPLFMDDKFTHEINEFIDQLQSKDKEYNQFVEKLVDDLFIYTDKENKIIASKAFMQVNRESLINIFQELISWDRQYSKDMLKSINCPTLCILTDEHHCDYQKLKQEAPKFELGKVIGSKCWATLEVPEQVNAMIARFLRIHKLK